MANSNKRSPCIVCGIAIAAGPVILAVAIYMGFTLPFDAAVIAGPLGSGVRTPNPSNAPWYWLKLQEMWVYADPVLVERILPIAIPLAVGIGAALVVRGLTGKHGPAGEEESARLQGRNFLIAGLIVLFGIAGPYLAAMAAVGLMLLFSSTRRMVAGRGRTGR